MLLLIASIPGLATGLIIYWTATDQIQDELQRQHRSQIAQRAGNIDDQLAYLELTFSHWSFDPNFDEKLAQLDFIYGYEQVHELYRTLLVMEGTHPLIERVELYLQYPRPLLFTKDLYQELEDGSRIDELNALLVHDQTEFWTDGYRPSTGRVDDSSSVALVNKLPGGSTEPIGYLVTTINQTRLNKLLRTLTPYDDGSTFLMTEQGEWMFAGSGASPGGLEEALRAEYLRRGAPEESFLLDYNDTTYSVSYGKLSRLGESWVYVSAAPVTAITAPVLFVSKLILWVSACGLLLALILSLLASYRLYSPIERLVRLLSGERQETGFDNRDEFELIERQWRDLSREKQSLLTRLDEHLPLMRDGFLLQLVQGYLFSLNEKEIRDRLRHYGWESDGMEFVPVLVQLQGFADLEGRFSPGDEDLVTFAAANILTELTEAQIPQFQVLNFHDLSIGLLLTVPRGSSPREFRDRLRRLCGEWIQAVSYVLKMRLTIAIGRPTGQLRHIPFDFEAVRQALNYGDAFGGSQIIDLEELDTADSTPEFSYPFSLEKEIIHAVRIGSEEEAGELIDRFMEELSASGGAKLILQQGMMQLLGSLLHAMMHSGMNPVRLFDGANLFEQLAALNEPTEIPKWFRRKVIGPFVRELISKQDHQLKQLVEKTIQYVHDQYTSGVLSLELCADRLGTSPYTLSRAFKQITGVNFIDYVTNLRIERAKELLRDTEMKINEVAESVSYQHTYFNRIFKKYEGITPSQYREMSRPGT